MFIVSRVFIFSGSLSPVNSSLAPLQKVKAAYTSQQAITSLAVSSLPLIVGAVLLFLQFLALFIF